MPSKLQFCRKFHIENLHQIIDLLQKHCLPLSFDTRLFLQALDLKGIDNSINTQLINSFHCSAHLIYCEVYRVPLSYILLVVRLDTNISNFYQHGVFWIETSLH